MFSFTPQPLYYRRNIPRYTLDKRLSGPQSRSGGGGEEKNPRPCRESNPSRPTHRLLAIGLLTATLAHLYVSVAFLI